MIFYFTLLAIAENINSYFAGYRISTFYHPNTDYTFFAYMLIHAILGTVILNLSNIAKFYYVEKTLEQDIVSDAYSFQVNKLIYDYTRYQTRTMLCIVNIAIGFIVLFYSYAITHETMSIILLSLMFYLFIYYIFKNKHNSELDKYNQFVLSSQESKTKPQSLFLYIYKFKYVEVCISSSIYLGGYTLAILIYLFIQSQKSNMEPVEWPSYCYKLMFISGKCSLIYEILNLSMRNECYSALMDKLNVKKPQISDYKAINYLLSRFM